MEEGKQKSPRRSPRIHSDGDTSNQKVYRRSRMRGQVSSPTATDEVNDGPNFSLGISQVSVVLPYYLSVVKFYDKHPELKATPKYSGIDEFEKIEFHFITKGVPRQQDDSL
ncbi:hypothetical protein RDI58_024525 [Solanum bulbocastanum]|uniref:Uncharacterized protein n=1 Tax=Solanum bulbocastanum TaxID=147425 RepID=A0AAN8Y3J6_SOLBU